MTCSAVPRDVHDEDELDFESVSVLLAVPVTVPVAEVAEGLIEEAEAVLVFELLSSSPSVRSSFTDVKSFSAPSIPWILSVLTWAVMLSKFSSIHDRELTILVMEPNKFLFRFGARTQGLDKGTLPNFEIRPSTSLLTSLIPFMVSDLSGLGFAFQLMMTGMRSATCEDTDETADVASALARVVVAGGRVVAGKIPPPVMMGFVTVVSDCITTVVTMPMVTPADAPELLLLTVEFVTTDADEVVVPTCEASVAIRALVLERLELEENDTGKLALPDCRKVVVLGALALITRLELEEGVVLL